MYFITTKTATVSVTGKMRFTAANVLAFISNKHREPMEIEVHDEDGKLVTVEQLRKEAGR